MVKGCQKKIIYLKNTGSDVFDEAYFVLNDKNPIYEMGECDMVFEANKILDECISKEEKICLFKKITSFIKTKATPFLLGTVAGIIIGIIIK